MSRPTYERLKTYCETNGISMSEFVERRVGDFLGRYEPPPARTDETKQPAARKLTPEQIFTF